MDVKDWRQADKQRLFEYLRWNSYVSERHNIFYVSTPKVACTSLKWWFASLEGYSQALRLISDSSETDPDLVVHESHKVAPHVTGLMPEELSNALMSDDYFRFAVVRNPYKRIFSAWQSKLLLQEPLQIGPYTKFDFFNYPIKNEHDIATAFEGFLEHLADNEAPSYWDHHWAPQVTLLRPDLIRYSKLARIEEPEALSRSLADWLGEYSPDPFLGRRTNESLIPYLSEFVTDRSADLIRTLYAEDFDAFGYQKQPISTQEIFNAEQLAVAIKAIKFIRARHQRLRERTEQITHLHHLIADREEHVCKLNQVTIGLNAQIVHLKQITTDQEAPVAHLNQVAADREVQIAHLNQAAADREDQITHLNQIAADREAQITNLNNVAALQESRIANLDQSIAKLEGNILSLSQVIEERDRKISMLNNALTELHERAGLTKKDGFRMLQWAKELNATVIMRDEEIIRLKKKVVDKDDAILKIWHSIKS